MPHHTAMVQMGYTYADTLIPNPSVSCSPFHITHCPVKIALVCAAWCGKSWPIDGCNKDIFLGNRHWNVKELWTIKKVWGIYNPFSNGSNKKSKKHTDTKNN